MNNEQNSDQTEEDQFTPLVPPVTLDKSGKIREMNPKPARPKAPSRPSRKGRNFRALLSGVLKQIRNLLSRQNRSAVPAVEPPAETPSAPVVEPPPVPEVEPPVVEKPAAAESPPPEEPVKTGYSNRIFVVHGTDERMKNKVVPALKKLGLEPVRFDEGTNEELTLYERSERNPDVGFAVVLLTIEDMAYPKNEKPAAAKARVSQGVVFQLGFLSAKLGRQRVFVLYPRKDNFELPTRFFDAYYTPFDDEGRWKRYLADRLKSCGYEVPERTVL
jgi:predicted nucleotide-binding protein